jgi:hypothetical protein
VEHFNRAFPVQRHVLGGIHHTHSSFTDSGKDAVTTFEKVSF